MHDYYTILKVQIQLSTNGILPIFGYISGANERSNGRLRVCQSLSRRFSHNCIRIIRVARNRCRGGYEETPIV